jgi:GDP-mannose transporter
VGNVCKVLTVAINYFIWTKHANNAGLCSLGMCLAAAYFYKQAPMRNDDAAVAPTGADESESKEEKQPLKG